MVNSEGEMMSVDRVPGGQTSTEPASPSDFLNSVVTVYATSIEPDFAAPWDT